MGIWCGLLRGKEATQVVKIWDQVAHTRPRVVATQSLVGTGDKNARSLLALKTIDPLWSRKPVEDAVNHGKRDAPPRPGLAQAFSSAGRRLRLFVLATSSSAGSDRVGAYCFAVTDVFDRVKAVSATVQLWPDEPSAGSGFADDLALSAQLSSYTMARTQLLTSMRRLRNAARLVKEDDDWGTHLLMLRPALVLAAKASWIVRPNRSEERVSRTLGMLSNDQRRGAKAMREAVSQAAIPEFKDVADKFDRSSGDLVSGVPIAPVNPPGDQTMIRELGGDVNAHYGTDDASSDMQLLWNVSSSLAHGETWFSLLSGGLQRKPFADILTAQSFDIVRSGINTTSLRILRHATTPPGPPVPSHSSTAR